MMYFCTATTSFSVIQCSPQSIERRIRSIVEWKVRLLHGHMNIQVWQFSNLPSWHAKSIVSSYNCNVSECANEKFTQNLWCKIKLHIFHRISIGIELHRYNWNAHSNFATLLHNKLANLHHSIPYHTVYDRSAYSYALANDNVGNVNGIDYVQLHVPYIIPLYMHSCVLCSVVHK